MKQTLAEIGPKGRYSISETSELLGIHRDTLYKYTHKTGEIDCQFHRRGGKLVKYYLGSEIIRFWNNGVMTSGDNEADI